MKTLLCTVLVATLFLVISCDKYECEEYVLDCSDAMVGHYSPADETPAKYSLTLEQVQSQSRDKQDKKDKFGSWGCDYGCDDDDDYDDDDDDYPINTAAALEILVTYQAEEGNVATYALRGEVLDNCTQVQVAEQMVNNSTWKADLAFDEDQLSGMLYHDGQSIPVVFQK